MKISLVSAVVMLALASTFVPVSAHHSWPVNMDRLVTVKATDLGGSNGSLLFDVHDRGP